MEALQKMTKIQLQDELDKRKIAWPTSAKKADLISTLMAAGGVKAAPASPARGRSVTPKKAGASGSAPKTPRQAKSPVRKSPPATRGRTAKKAAQAARAASPSQRSPSTSPAPVKRLDTSTPSKTRTPSPNRAANVRRASLTPLPSSPRGSLPVRGAPTQTPIHIVAAQAVAVVVVAALVVLFLASRSLLGNEMSQVVKRFFGASH